MPEPGFDSLQRSLLDSGIAPRCVRRIVVEVGEHYDDLWQEGLGRGLTADEATAEARARLGSEASIVSAARSRTELLCWAHRWPWAARWLRACALVVVLPAVPVVYCVYQGPTIVRWGVSASLASLLTGTMLLLLHSMIA